MPGLPSLLQPYAGSVLLRITLQGCSAGTASRSRRRRGGRRPARTVYIGWTRVHGQRTLGCDLRLLHVGAWWKGEEGLSAGCGAGMLPLTLACKPLHGLQGRDALPNAPGMDGKNLSYLSQPLN